MADLLDVLRALVGDSHCFPSRCACHPHKSASVGEQLESMDTWAQFQVLKQLLCVRHPRKPLEPALLDTVDDLLQWECAHRVLTDAASLPPAGQPIGITSLHLWQGDITTLSGLTAITNAANSRMLGCYQPAHRCIDNVIHARAGPRLREECYRLMRQGTRELPVGQACATSGYCLPASYIIHTVGPQLDAGQPMPTANQREQLRQCYEAILEVAESLPLSDMQGKTIALCGISTGLFAFPVEEAAPLAVAAVTAWLQRNPQTTITNVIFNTFLDADTAIYKTLLPEIDPVPSLVPQPRVTGDSLSLVISWLTAADTILVSCGAGISAAAGLDYTSTALFQQHFPAFAKLHLRRLYDTFGMTLSDWPSEGARWGFYLTHLEVVRRWPRSTLYDSLLGWLNARFAPEHVHVRTSNADGFFRAHGLPETQLSTPQGQYAFFQCLDNCRPDAVFPSVPYLDAALPYLDPLTQTLTREDRIPVCQFCGGTMSICVRAGDWFNEGHFREGEERWARFKERLLSDRRRNVVILELGVGLSTPGVLRWNNEDLVQQGEGRVRLVRVGLGDAVHVPVELETEQLATGVEGDLNDVVRAIVSEA
ncbi:appr-1-p processing enzyme family protein [Aspergillus ellipticus CBS 707.79]|uniref:Appr-1-p processing enzyme family protein n=1 Tax=Aspergillus ellipticus CBS 707.79 TaxID=1448320 RepID=A0A319CZW7_9EURO|nr:appr-1-p processing enzyme family protein [Aspergillus ellipticus CBS 707.79]